MATYFTSPETPWENLSEAQVLWAVRRCIEWCCPELPEVTAATVGGNWRRFLDRTESDNLYDALAVGYQSANQKGTP